MNQLEEDDFKKKEVQNTLKMLRANLKLAIDNALLPSQQSNLLSSYLQVLIMSEGDAWLHRSVHDLALIIRAEDARPVAQAEALVRRFSTKELRSVPGGVGDVDEYVANATLDLVIMSVWSVAAGQIGAEALPVSGTKGILLTPRPTHSHATSAPGPSSPRHCRRTGRSSPRSTRGYAR